MGGEDKEVQATQLDIGTALRRTRAKGIEKDSWKMN